MLLAPEPLISDTQITQHKHTPATAQTGQRTEESLGQCFFDTIQCLTAGRWHYPSVSTNAKLGMHVFSARRATAPRHRYDHQTQRPKRSYQPFLWSYCLLSRIHHAECSCLSSEISAGVQVRLGLGGAGGFGEQSLDL